MSGKCDEPLRADVDITQPRYDQNTYLGRVLHYLHTTNPLNIFVAKKRLEEAKSVLDKYKNKEKLCITEEELWHEKQLCDSAYHPDTGEYIPPFGRMSSQVAANMVIVGGMLTFYKKALSVIFWQWLNQSYNAYVNYCNRSGDAVITNEQFLSSYVGATGGAVAAALGLNHLVKYSPPLIGRFVPFVAVAVANCINIPLMRITELKIGTPVFDDAGKKIGQSVQAAIEGISMVVFSRIILASPGLLLPPVAMDYLEKRGTLCRYPWLPLPFQVVFVGLMTTVMVPLCCGIFKQQALIHHSRLEPEIQDKLDSTHQEFFVYNKGL